MSNMHRLVTTIFALVLSSSGAIAQLADQTTLTLRGGYAPIQCTVESITLDGVVFRPAGDSQANQSTRAHLLRLPLSDVASVDGNHASEFALLESTADTFWRARARLARGDVVLAEPLFESLAQQFGGRSGESAAIVGGGLLQCKLDRGRLTQANDAWLTLVDIRMRQHDANQHAASATGNAGPADLSLTPRAMPIDEKLLLCPSLPPIWLDTPQLQGWSSRPAPADITSSVAITLFQLYQAGASAESGWDGATVPALSPTDPDAVRTVHEIVSSRIGTQSERDVARESLRERLASNPPAWLGAWCQTALGRSLVRETDPDTRWLGVVQLLRVPAEMPRASRYLTGIALAEAAVVSAELGDSAGASSLRSELAVLYPDHPAMHWLPIRDWNPEALVHTPPSN